MNWLRDLGVFIRFMWINFIRRPLQEKILIRWKIVRYDICFVVYAGVEEEERAFAPWFRDALRKRKSFYWIDAAKGKKNGLVIALSYSLDQLLVMPKEDFENILKEIAAYAYKYGFKLVPLAGQLPSIAKETHHLDLDPIFETGEDFSICAVLETMDYALEARGSASHRNSPFCTFGIGSIGRFVFRYFGREMRHESIGLDPRMDGEQRSGSLLLSDNFSLMAGCRVFLILSPRGDDIEPHLDFLKAGDIIIFDTHPLLSQRLREELQRRGIIIYEVGFEVDGWRFIHGLPGRPKNMMVGCYAKAYARCLGYTGTGIAAAREWVQDSANDMRVYPQDGSGGIIK